MKQLSLLLLLLLLPLGTTHAARSSVDPVDRVVVVVDDDVITRSELEKRLRSILQQLQRNRTPAPPSEVLQRQVVELLIIEKIQLSLAERGGLRVDDESLNQIIANVAAQNRMSLDQLRNTLQREGIPFADYREEIRKEVLVTRLRASQVDNRISVSQQEARSWLERSAAGDPDTEYRLAQILIPLPETPSPEQLQAARQRGEEVLRKLRGGADFGQMAASYSSDQQALQGGELGWRSAPQLQSVIAERLVVMKPGELSELLRTTNGLHIIKLLDKRGGERHVVRQRHARHILIRTDAVTADHEARAKLERLRQRLAAGEDFATLAKAHSDDKGSAAQGGDLGWSNPGSFVPEFEETLGKLAVGATSGVFRSQFGWHLVQLLGYRDYDSTDELLLAQAGEALRKRKIEEEQENWRRRLRDEAYVEYHLDE